MSLKENNDEYTRVALYTEISVCKERLNILQGVNDMSGGALVAVETGRLMLQIQDAMKELVKLIG